MIELVIVALLVALIGAAVGAYLGYNRGYAQADADHDLMLRIRRGLQRYPELAEDTMRWRRAVAGREESER